MNVPVGCASQNDPFRLRDPGCKLRAVSICARSDSTPLEFCTGCPGMLRTIACIEDAAVNGTGLTCRSTRTARPDALQRPPCRTPLRRRGLTCYNALHLSNTSGWAGQCVEPRSRGATGPSLAGYGRSARGGGGSGPTRGDQQRHPATARVDPWLLSPVHSGNPPKRLFIRLVLTITAGCCPHEARR